MKQKIYGKVRDGQLDELADLQLLAAIAANTEKDIVITVERGRKKRSLNQNAFFHGPFLEGCQNMFLEGGSELSADMVKECLKRKFGLKIQVKMPDGSEEYEPKSTADYTTSEIEDFMDKIRAWAGAFGYDLPYVRDTHNQ
jgi:hypothetical protein